MATSSPLTSSNITMGSTTGLADRTTSMLSTSRPQPHLSPTKPRDTSPRRQPAGTGVGAHDAACAAADARALTEVVLLHLFSLPSLEDRAVMIAQRLRLVPSKPSPSTITTTSVPSRPGGATTPTSANAAAATVPEPESLAVRRGMVQADVYYYAIECVSICSAACKSLHLKYLPTCRFAYRARFPHAAILATVHVVRRTLASAFLYAPRIDLAADVQVLASHILSVMVPQPPAYTTALTIDQGTALYAHLLDTLFRSYLLYKHVLSRRPAPRDAGHLLAPRPSLETLQTPLPVGNDVRRVPLGVVPVESSMPDLATRPPVMPREEWVAAKAKLQEAQTKWAEKMHAAEAALAACEPPAAGE
ncbi:hypothetical protein AMAG_06282 [Allomyces macrogynus ATCC 38327]|uniref:Uncharacterized protein n=1 Tax=Allomyces macrogynus (strain ATCC 38327) TaxID=578462 RepID=A0A0L0SG94_ALLM3|nr:hypothetical protein AMAG_06282 [Allomyces macrogynus ATCC 38327]|eukprot:KNE61462.1 hypothetical protein AMAG_06282 [Allomyces macrogynus ATCC 38327]